MLIHSLQLYNAQQIREFESIAIEKCKMPASELMRRAGEAAFKVSLEYWPCAKKIAVLCGNGNNGGDGYVFARVAHQAGLGVAVFCTTEPHLLKGEAKKAALSCQKANVKIETFHKNCLDGFDVIVDALLGIGASGDVKGPIRESIEAINNSKLPVLALDVPSGLDVNTGDMLGVSVNADVTVTFIALKQGLFTGFGKGVCGIVKCSDLGIPKEIFHNTKKPAVQLLSLPHLMKELPQRGRLAHKGDCGHVLVVGGDYGMAGAVRMASEAAARVGAGLVTVATRREHVQIVSANRPEIMCYGVNDARDMESLLSKASVVVIGPGLGHSSWSIDLFDACLSAEKPMIVDADALNILSKNPTKRANWILTPHPGEAACLLNSSSKGVQENRFKAICDLNTTYGGVSVLKGSGTLICEHGGNTYVCPFGNPGMASGGMGDILSGVIGGFVAQGFGVAYASRLGVALHSASADLVVNENGERGLLAMDLLPYIRKLLNLK